MNKTDDREAWTIHVYRDSPEWDRYEKWFMLPAHVLGALFVCTYDYRSYSRPSEASKTVQKLRLAHPNCVFIY